MSRVGARHVAIAAALIAGVAAIALWLRDPGPTDEASPPAKPVAAAAVRVAGTKPKRVRAAAELPASGAKAARASLVVAVVDSAKRAPCGGAVVCLIDGECDDWRAETAADGVARFDELPPGRTEVRAAAPGCMPSDRTLLLAPGANEKAEVVLGPATEIEGSVVDSLGGTAVAGAQVELTDADDGRPEHRTIDESVTDAAGRFRFLAVPAARPVALTASAPGHGEATASAVSPAAGDPPLRVEIRMGRTGVVRGFVRGPDGSVVDDGWVHVAQKGADAGRDAVTRDDGSYRVEEVPLGAEQIVTAGAMEWADAAPVADVVLTADQPETSLDLVLRKTATLIVRVLDPAGHAVTADLVVDGSATGGRWITGDVFVRDRLRPGRHALRASADGFPPVDREVDVPDGERVEVELRLEPPAAIAGVVVDEAGAPVAGAIVLVVDPDPETRSRVASVGAGVRRRVSAAAGFVGGRGRQPAPAASGPDGSFRIDGLARGPHKLAVQVGGLLAVDAAHRPVRVWDVGAPANDVRVVVSSATQVRVHVVLPDDETTRRSLLVSQCAPDAVAGIVGDGDGEGGVEIAFGEWVADSTLRCVVAARPSALRIRVAGFAPVVLPMTPREGAVTDLGDVRLAKGLTISGTVVDATRHAVARASVRGVDTPGAREILSGPDGAFTVGGLAAGPAVIRAHAANRLGSAFVGDASRAGHVTIVLREMGVLHVAVVDAAGAPAKGAPVSVRHGAVPGTADPGWLTTQDANDAGTLDVVVAAGRCRAGAGDAWVEADVPEGGEAGVRVVAR